MQSQNLYVLSSFKVRTNSSSDKIGFTSYFNGQSWSGGWHTDPRNIVSVSKIGVHEINSFSRPKLSEKSISAIFRKIQRAPSEKIRHFEKSCQNLGRFFNFEAFLTCLQPISWKIKAFFGNLKQFYRGNLHYLLYFFNKNNSIEEHS